MSKNSRQEITASNIFDVIPNNINEEVFDILLQNDRITIERIISKGQSSPKSGWYDQNENEWVIILKGAATISLEESDDISLSAGSHLHIPAHTKHQVKWTDPDIETIWLAVFY